MKPIGQATLLQKSKDIWEPFPVEVVWLSEPADWTFASAWHSAGRAADSASHRDSLEYATLAGKRWRYLEEQGLVPASPAELRDSAEKQPTGEFGLALALRERTPAGSILGVAFARRTWANNLMLEFLAASPHASNGIKGVGRALMQALALIGLSLQCGELWGECTELSQGFYVTLKSRTSGASPRKQQLGEVGDRFQFTARELQVMLERTQVRIAGCAGSSPGTSSRHEKS